MCRERGHSVSVGAVCVVSEVKPGRRAVKIVHPHHAHMIATSPEQASRGGALPLDDASSPPRARSREIRHFAGLSRERGSGRERHPHAPRRLILGSSQWPSTCEASDIRGVWAES